MVTPRIWKSHICSKRLSHRTSMVNIKDISEDVSLWFVAISISKPGVDPFPKSDMFFVQLILKVNSVCGTSNCKPAGVLLIKMPHEPPIRNLQIECYSSTHDCHSKIWKKKTTHLKIINSPSAPNTQLKRCLGTQPPTPKPLAEGKGSILCNYPVCFFAGYSW